MIMMMKMFLKIGRRRRRSPCGRPRHLCRALALICFMIGMKDQHKYIFLETNFLASLATSQSVLPWRLWGTVRCLLLQQVLGYRLTSRYHQVQYLSYRSLHLSIYIYFLVLLLEVPIESVDRCRRLIYSYHIVW